MLLVATGVEGKSLSEIHQEFLKTKLEAVKGSPENQHRLGVLYERGLGVAKDEVAAAQWFQRAADLDYAPAQYALARCYRAGRGVSANPEQAVKWFRKAADHGLADAQNSLGFSYQMGLGLPADQSQAVSWFQ